MRPVQLNVVEGGISRLRVKGRASEKTLYDAVNCYVTADNTVRNRPGTRRLATLPAGTKGLCAFQEKLHTFATQFVDTSAIPLVTVNVINHPTQPTLALEEIHFAQPFMGALYVVAEFVGGDVFHYWLQEVDAEVWEPNRVYSPSAVVRPTVRNGFAYRARSLVDPPPTWAPDTPRQVGDRVVPTVPNGFYYEVTDVFGASPRSGPSEPDWPTNDGQVVNEDSEGERRPVQQDLPSETPSLILDDFRLPDNFIDRYWTFFP